MEHTVLKFPSSPSPLNGVIHIHAPKNLGVTAGIFTHEYARKLPLYNQPIECEDVGQDKDGNSIAINSLGRWLFGVPGYGGHTRVVADDRTIFVYYPKSTSDVVNEFMKSLKELIENN